MGALNTVPRLVGVICALILVGCARTTECDPYVGVCPRPQVGVVVNDAGFVKSIWLEEPGITISERGVAKTICRGELDVAPGEEILFRGDEAFVVTAADSPSPQILSRVPASLYGTSLIDIEGDGNIEYIEQYGSEIVRLRNHAGEVLWEVVSDSDKAPHSWWSRSLWFDIDGDAFLEFMIGTDHGVELRSADGTILTTIGSVPYGNMHLGQFDEDAELELALREAPSQDELGRIETFDLDGTLLGSFLPPDRDADSLFSYFYVVPDPTVPGLERIMAGCRIYDPAGNEVGVLDENEYGYCYTGRAIVERDELITSCSVFVPQEMETPPFNVQFDVQRDVFRVEVTYSFERYEFHNIVSAGSRHNTMRTVVMIYDQDGSLVYHEVLDSKSGPGSFAVVPSEVEGAEVLLLADDSTVFAYSLPAATP